jgi:hypothetical protein
MSNGFFEKSRLRLYVTGNELGHLKHRDRLFTVEHEFQVVVSINLSPDLRILKFVLFDIIPKLLGQLSAREWFCSHHRRQEIIGLNRLEERSVGFASRFFLSGFDRFLHRFRYRLFDRFLSCHWSGVWRNRFK